MLLRTGSVACLVLVVLVLAAGCGGAPARQAAPPKLPRALAQRWAAEADRVAAAVQANDGCGAQQLARALATQVDASTRRIPVRFRATVVSAAATLAGRIACVAQPAEKPKPKPEPPKGPKGPKGPDKHKHGDGQGGGDGG